jgi:replicative DNA helicase
MISTKNGSEQQANGLKKPGPLINGAGSPTSTAQRSTISLPGPTEPILVTLSRPSEILENVLANIYQRGTEPKYPTGLKALDDVIWGMHKKELMIIGARTSQGKSTLAMQIAISLADQGARIGYFSLEMSKEQLMERIIAHMTGIDARQIRHGLAKDRIRENEKFLRDCIPNLKILFDDENGYTFDNIVAICEKLRFDFVFIDYIQMISIRGYRTKLEAIDEYVRKFKELCKMFDFGGVLISQINREGADNMTLANLKGSGTLEEHPDTVILLEWDTKKNEYRLRIDKQRHGEIRTINVDYDPAIFRMKDVSPRPITTKRRGDDI